MIFTVLVKKEIEEMISSYKILILPVIFVFFGILQPIMMHMLPDILESVGTEGMIIEFPPMTFSDSMCEYFSSILQLGAIVVVLIAMGTIAKERTSGTAALILSKPVSRASFMAAKFTAYSLLTLVSFFLGTLACWYYTEMLIGSVKDSALLLVGVGLLAILLIFLIALVIFTSTLFKNQIVAGISSLMVFYLLGILPIFGGLWEKATPYALMNRACDLVKGSTENLSTAVLPNIVVIGILMIAAWQVFEHQEL